MKSELPDTRCPLCGARIDDADGCRTSCPIASHCMMIRCGNCGHELPDPRRSWIARWLARRLSARLPGETHP